MGDIDWQREIDQILSQQGNLGKYLEADSREIEKSIDAVERQERQKQFSANVRAMIKRYRKAYHHGKSYKQVPSGLLNPEFVEGQFFYKYKLEEIGNCVGFA